MMLKIGILTGSEYKSPRVLAETLSHFIDDAGHSTEVFYKVKALHRLYSAKVVKVNYFKWLLHRVINFPGDFFLFRKLKKMDAIIVCACTPYGFYKDSYNVTRFKEIINNKPVLYYSVQYLGNSPTIQAKLKNGGHASFERYDWHIAVSPVTEIRSIPAPHWNYIGINLRSTGLKPEKKDELLAIVDFLQPGHEKYREMQISILEDLKIKYISLEKNYTINEIRDLYKRASLYFIQSPEAFGLPIAECLACGAYVCTPESWWPMSWRLDRKLEVHGPGTLPDCFIIYNDPDHLRQQLVEIIATFDPTLTPSGVFDIFYKNYRYFYEGDLQNLNDLLERIEKRDFN